MGKARKEYHPAAMDYHALCCCAGSGNQWQYGGSMKIIIKFSVLILSAILWSQVHLCASEQTPLLLSDFEGDLSTKWGHNTTRLSPVQENYFVKEGAQSGKWENLHLNPWMALKEVPSD